MKRVILVPLGALTLSDCASLGYEPVAPEFQRAIARALGHTKARPIPTIAISDQWKFVTDELAACVRSSSKYEMYIFTKGMIVYSAPESTLCKTLLSYRPLPPIYVFQMVIAHSGLLWGKWLRFVIYDLVVPVLPPEPLAFPSWSSCSMNRMQVVA